MRSLAMTVVTLGAAAFAACSAPQSDDTSGSDNALRPVERALVGAPAPYVADTKLRDRKAELINSMKARRAAAWQVVARAIKPVQIADPPLRWQGKATLPTFRTWYHKDDIERATTHLYEVNRGDLSKVTDPKEVDKALAWNDGGDSIFRFWDRRAVIDNQRKVNGLGGNQRVVYSPAFVRHLMVGHKTVIANLPNAAEIAKLPRDEKNEAPLLDAEFPPDAAIVKTTWFPAGTMPLFDTNAPALRAKRDGSSDRGGWGAGPRSGPVKADQMYTVELEDNTSFSLAGMHIVTKELREWIWITLFWSENPNSDFGADRPSSIGGAFANYKMCVVVDEAEGDPDPRGGYPKTGPLASLGDAIEALHEGKGGPTWCSNPYVEQGDKNAQTNCMGCHQHAGLPGMTSESILADEVAFPKSGRVKQRDTFPADYTWAIGSLPEQLAVTMRDVASYYSP